MKLVSARAAVERQREEHGNQGREQDGPGDAAGPDAQHGNQAFLNCVLTDGWLRHGLDTSAAEQHKDKKQESSQSLCY